MSLVTSRPGNDNLRWRRLKKTECSTPLTIPHVGSPLSQIQVGLWPDSPIAALGVTPESIQQLVFPSARQGLTRAVRLLGGSRGQFIAIPEYSGHCVISAVGKVITPLPIPFALHCPQRISQVLLYNQWGWERPVQALDEVQANFPSARIILDRVDSLADTLERLIEVPFPDHILQVFSLAKTLGLPGGGFVRLSAQWVSPGSTFDLPPETIAVGDLLHRLMDELPRHSFSRSLLPQWIRSDIPQPSPELTHWLCANDLALAYQRGSEARRSRVTLLRRKLSRLHYPTWMERQVCGETGILPGIAPLLCDDIDTANQMAESVRGLIGIGVGTYHFDVSPSYLYPDWRPAVALPIHWQVSVPEVERTIELFMMKQF